MTSGIVLGIGLGFNDYAPEQAAVVLAFHQPAANQLRSNKLRWTAEEETSEGWQSAWDGLIGSGRNLIAMKGVARGKTYLKFSKTSLTA